MHIVLYLMIPLGTWIAWMLWPLRGNYRIAKRTNLPIILSPVSLLNPFWIITYKLLFPSIIPILKSLPIGYWPRCLYMGWQFDDKGRLHDELGPAFVICTPSANEVVVANPDAAYHILHRRKDFVKPATMYQGLNVFGRNLDTVEGDTWQRHRKITAPSFNERISSAVWDESVRQSGQMLQEWIRMSDREGIRDTTDDTASLALNVLTSAGFGINYDFKRSKTQMSPPHTMSYRDALQCILRNFTLILIIPMDVLKLSIFPRTWQTIGQACQEFKLYMRETVDEEKKASLESADKPGEVKNLLGALVRASEAEQQGLSDEELYGNIFIYNMAGHETTANALATAIMYLAANPEWQDWAYEEIAAVARDDNEDGWRYETGFPRLNRCKAVMLETLRLHGSVVFLPKATTVSQPLIIKEREVIIPGNTSVTVNSQAIHCDLETWGKDALKWRPSRWIQQSDFPTAAREELIEPRPGSFVAWAEGPRVCPGRKFSQVEFVGVLSTLFRNHRVSPKPQMGKSRATVQEKLVRMIDDSNISSITLKMRKPRDVALVWTKI